MVLSMADVDLHIGGPWRPLVSSPHCECLGDPNLHTASLNQPQPAAPGSRMAVFDVRHGTTAGPDPGDGGGWTPVRRMAVVRFIPRFRGSFRSMVTVFIRSALGDHRFGVVGTACGRRKCGLGAIGCKNRNMDEHGKVSESF